MYIVAEGHDLAGKDFFIDKLLKAQAKLGKETLVVSEPHMGHPTGQQIRDFLKDKTTDCETLYDLYRQNREYLWNAVIRPALEAGKVVISSRNYLSSMVYQEKMGMMNVLGHNNQNNPDIIYVLSTTHETYVKRLQKKKNLEVVEREMADKTKFENKVRRYKEAGKLIERLRRTMVIHVQES